MVLGLAHSLRFRLTNHVNYSDVKREEKRTVCSFERQHMSI